MKTCTMYHKNKNTNTQSETSLDLPVRSHVVHRINELNSKDNRNSARGQSPVRRPHQDGFRYFGSSDDIVVQMRQRSASDLMHNHIRRAATNILTTQKQMPTNTRIHTVTPSIHHTNTNRTNRSLVNKRHDRDRSVERIDVGNVQTKSQRQSRTSSIFNSQDNVSGGTVTLQVEKQPRYANEAPVYVFDDEPKRPNLLQRSKTFFINRTASVRRSFRGKLPRQDGTTQTEVFESSSHANKIHIGQQQKQSRSHTDINQQHQDKKNPTRRTHRSFRLGSGGKS